MEARCSGNKKKFKKILLFLHSPGGILEAAVKFMDILRIYAEEVVVVVPMMAKSAATVMALSGDHLYMTTLSELGSVNPMVQSPSNPALRIPATSIDNFIKYYGRNAEETSAAMIDDVLRRKMEQALDPYLLGSYKGALEYSKQEVEGSLKEYSMKGKPSEEIEKAVKEFTVEHASHGHPITFKTINKYGIGELLSNGSKSDKAKLNAIKMLLSVYQNFMAFNSIVKLVGNRDENKNLIIRQQNNLKQQQLPTRTSA
jgi:hypothetical protein